MTPLGVFIHDSDDGKENTLIAFEGYTKLRGTASLRDDKIRIQNKPDTLDEAVWKKKKKEKGHSSTRQA